LDTLEPLPTIALISAEETKARLREIVEGSFFQRRPSDRKRRFLTRKWAGGNQVLLEGGRHWATLRAAMSAGVKSRKPQLRSPG
jgi:hypothetical protein